MKRVLVTVMHHESNSFNPIVAGEKDFNVLREGEFFDNFRKNDSLTGVCETLMKAGYEVVPTVSCRAVPNGEVDYDFYMARKAEIIEIAKREHAKKPLDAITLSLHGSMRVKGLGEAEGPLLEELRALFPELPIFSSLDMHTTMTDKMHNNCNGFVCYKCAPHTDCYETGEHAALDVAFKSIEEGVWPVFLSDSGDNPTAGSSCDVTEFIKIMMEDERTLAFPQPVAYGGFYDPEACAQCEGKVGQEIELTFGGTCDVAVFNTHNIDVIIAEKHIGYAGPKVYLDMGLNLAERQIVVCKLGYLGEEHEAFSKRGILVLTKGSTNEDLPTLPYEKIPRPLFPIDKDFDFDPKDYLK